LVDYKLAAHGNFVSTLEILRTNDCLDLEAKDDTGWTPFLTAASSGALQALRWLMSAGAKFDCSDRFGRNCLHLAVLKGKRAIIHEMVHYDADRGKLKSMEDCKARTPQAMLGTGNKCDRDLLADLASLWEGAATGDLNQILAALQRDKIDDASPLGWTALMSYH